MHSSTVSDHSSRSSEAKLFGIEFSDLHVSKEDSVQPRCDQLDSQLFEAEDFADEDSVLVPTDVACDASAHGGRFVAVDLLECARAQSQASSIRARASTTPENHERRKGP